MKVPLSWLNEYIHLDIPPVELAFKLTMAGVETSYTPGPSANWKLIFVGHVIDLQPHPDAQRLRLAKIDVGNELISVVCGAPNIEIGQHIALARVGANLNDPRSGQPFTLAAATIRGILSEGMVCSERELGIGDNHEGILVLPSDTTIGRPLAEIYEDGVLDLDLTTNRGDCLSVIGAAREVAAITGGTIIEPVSHYVSDGPDITQSVTLTLENPELCTRYLATKVQGVKVGQSPEWMQRHLSLAGLRPINNIVDVTNYVMLEYGQPLHAFDFSVIKEQSVIVRSAKPDEHLVALDGVDYQLRSPMLVIADSDRPIGLAGIMGGANSEINDHTETVLIEAATFDPTNTRRTSQTLKIRSEASTRFEKGLHPDLAQIALQRATFLILQTAGGVADIGVAEVYPAPVPGKLVTLRIQRVNQILGADLSYEQISGALTSLGFVVTDGLKSGKTLTVLEVKPPYWRMDIQIEEDLIEEVARCVGYDLIPSTPLEGEMPNIKPQPIRILRERVRDSLVSSGLQEVISYSLVSEVLSTATPYSSEPLKPGLQMANPMSKDQEYLRTSLRGGVLRALSDNLRRSSVGLGIFEIGRVFLPRIQDLPEEREMLFAAFSGNRGESLWDSEDAGLDFFDAKGVLNGIFDMLGSGFEVERMKDPLFHPGRCAKILVEGTPIGLIGELLPGTINAFEIPNQIVACVEVDLAALLEILPPNTRQYEPFSRYPLAVRDLALVVDKSIVSGDLKRIIEDHPLVQRVVLFDQFSGESLGPRQKSIAYRVEFQSSDRTLSAPEINEAMAGLVSKLGKETGAVLRS